MAKPAYCSREEGDCAKCSWRTGDMDCMNHPIAENVKQKGENE